MTRDERKEWCIDHAWVSGQDQDGRPVAINIEDKLMAAMAFADQTKRCEICGEADGRADATRGGERPKQYTIHNKTGIVDFWLEDEHSNRREYYGHKIVMAAEHEAAPPPTTKPCEVCAARYRNTTPAVVKGKEPR